ncbi:hypothetical protein FA13DRAFT_1721981 [Coprinellus micaceus]|uniref:Uncharacterized protein n=1 Tax=Coprinellus micaceus TaxID=71717 RepID=A0A4Y7RSW7_COPMI|nr:hypothetical protein FA13DRAFT_1721981 [Coprinellus micaceus]
MANTDTASPTLSTGTSLNGKASGPEHVVPGASTSETANDPPTTTTTPASPPSVSASISVTSASQPPSTAPVRSSLVPLGTGQASLSPASHPKKFSAVNVNKKFLEKTAQAASTATSPASSAAKSNATVGLYFCDATWEGGRRADLLSARPAVTHTLSHSRLVTAKLTASPIPSTAGWSRPASVAPTGSSSPNSASPLPTSAAPLNTASSAPQLPHVGKVIQPQPKAATLASSLGKEPFSGAKVVWGNVKPSGGSARLDIPAEDFPTAAEAVKGAALSAKKQKSEDAQPSEAAKHAKEEADAFRGVHLDPNAHHWDEMEEDDDDFLGGVVEFDDGRQYKVESVDGGDRPPSPGGDVRDRDTDDFDRSWPKSKTSPIGSSRDLTSPTDARSPTSSINGLHPGTSPVDSSRHLFNERLGRLEPYNHARTGPPSVSGRPHRDFSGPPPNILHKPAHDFPPRNRRFSGASTGSAAGPSISPRDSQFPRRDGPPPSPRMSRDGGHLMAPSTSFGGRERPEVSRRGNMGPPPVPPRALKTAQETGRQLPPHLTQNNAFRREPRPMNPEPPTPASSKAPSLPSHSPIAAHAQLSTVSPLIGSVAGLPLPQGTDLEEVRKDVMHTAAARAKQRREQEEAEREAQKERARKKAQELEEKMKAAALEKEKQEEQKKEAAEAEAKQAVPPSPAPSKAAVVDAIIEAAIQSAKATAPEAKPTPPPSTETGGRPFAGPHRPAIAKTDSWRSAAPAPAVQQRKASSGFVASAHTALDAAVNTKEEDLEALGAAHQKPNEASKEPYATARVGRPVASDFFDEQRSAPEPPKEVLSSWRRQAPIAQPEQLPSAAKDDGAAPDKDSSVSAANDELKQTTMEQTTPPSASSSRESLASSNDVNGRNGSAGPPRTPRSQAFFKEATMSSLDDTMSRIKGAITHMKARDVPDRPSEQYREPPYTRQPQQQGYLKPPRERWVPPALRQRHVGFLEDEEREVFDVTMVALPPSPPPSAFLVQLPKHSRTVEFIHRRQLQAFHKPQGPPRFELLSFDPPVEGMNRREFSVNDILFRKPGFFKGKPPKYRVLLPRRQPKGMLRGFGKTPVADTTASWRKPVVVAVEKPSKQSTGVAMQGSRLDTMSRSPPPDVLPSETSTSLPKPSESTMGKGDSHPGAHPGARPRPQPKMPAGSAVAVRRPSGIDAIESTANKTSSLNFIVSDELEDTREPAQTMEILSSDIPPPSVTPSHALTSQPQTVLPDLTKLVAPLSSAVPPISTGPSQDPSSIPSTLEAKPSENTNTVE